MFENFRNLKYFIAKVSSSIYTQLFQGLIKFKQLQILNDKIVN